MKKRITKQTCDQAMQAAELIGSPIKVFDDKLAGFGFRAAPRGEKASAFFVDYRLKARGKAKQRYTLGKFVELTPASAREKAQEFLGEIAKGNDPQAEKPRTKRGRPERNSVSCGPPISISKTTARATGETSEGVFAEKSRAG